MHRSFRPWAAALVTTALVAVAAPSVSAPTPAADRVVARAPSVGVPGVWSRTAPDDSEGGSDLTFAPGDPTTAFLGLGNGGLARTTDGGATWDHLGVAQGLDGINPAQRVRVDPGNPDRVVTSGNRGVYESVDGGDSFVLVEPAVTGRWVDGLELVAGTTPAETTGVAATSSSTAGPGILWSPVPGADWVDRSGNVADLGLHATAGKHLALHPAHPGLAVVTDGTVVLRTTDVTAGSPVWTSIRGTGPGGVLRDLAVVGTHLVAASNDGHLYRSPDALDPAVATPTWYDAGAPFGPGTGLFQAAPLGANGVLVGGTGGLAKTGNVTAATPSWGHLTAAPGRFGVGTVATADAAHLAIVRDSRVHGSDDGGLSFTTWDGVVNSTVVDVDAAGGRLLAPTYGGLLRSDDAGLTWQRLPQEGAFSASSVAVDPRDTDRVFATSGGAVQRSTDGGVSFTPATGLAPAAYARSVTVEHETAGVVWATMSAVTDAVYRSGDGGASFELADTGLPDNLYPAEVVTAPGPGGSGVVAYVYGNGGVFASTNGGASWVSQSDGLPGQLADLVVDPADPAHLVGSLSGAMALYETFDRGASWEQVDGFGTVTGAAAGQLAFSPRGGRLVVSVADHALSARLHQSVDGGANFTPLAPAVPYSTRLVNAIAYDSRGLHVATLGAGLFDLTFDADLRAAVSAPARAVAGAPFAIAVRPTATGVTELSGATVVVTAPAGVRVTSATTPGGTCRVQGRQSRCEQGFSVRTVTIRGTGTTAGRRTFTATVAADQVERTPANNTAAASVVVGKAATRLTARSTPTADTRAPHIFVLTGTLARADRRALACSGPVAVVAKNGARTVLTRRVTLTRSGTACRYRAVLSWSRAPARTLVVSASHAGSATLLPSRSPGVTVRLR